MRSSGKFCLFLTEKTACFMYLKLNLIKHTPVANPNSHVTRQQLPWLAACVGGDVSTPHVLLQSSYPVSRGERALRRCFPHRGHAKTSSSTRHSQRIWLPPSTLLCAPSPMHCVETALPRVVSSLLTHRTLLYWVLGDTWGWYPRLVYSPVPTAYPGEGLLMILNW